VHVPATQVTSIAMGAVFGRDRATDATASSHRTAGTPTHEIVGDAGGPLSAGAPQPAIAMTARTARRRRSVVVTTKRAHADLVLDRIDLATREASANSATASWPLRVAGDER
jgi:hypothetical protein